MATCGIPVPHPNHLWDDRADVPLTHYCTGVLSSGQPHCSLRHHCEMPDGHQSPCWPPPDLPQAVPVRRAPCGLSQPHGPHFVEAPLSADCPGLTGKVPDDHDKIIQLRKDLDNSIAEISAVKMALAHQASVLRRSLEAIEKLGAGVPSIRRLLSSDENAPPQC